MSVDNHVLEQLRIRDPNQSYIPAPAPGQPREQWIAALRQYRQDARSGTLRGTADLASTAAVLNRGIYDEAGQLWVRGAFTCHFTFMYDRSFYDPITGRYQLRGFLDDGEKEFGGYDVLLLWQGYPRLGVDPRNQFDFYRDMPGGLPAIRDLVGQAHRRGTRVFIDYNPWDQGSRREGKSDEDSLADLLTATEVDGVFLDTLSGSSPLLHKKLEAVHPGISLCPEDNPPIANLALCSASWAQWVGRDFQAAALDNRKWIEPRHMRWQIDRWNTDHHDEIRRAFFNGGGIIIWENVFGTYNPWKQEERRFWRRAAAILHQYRDLFSGDNWDPFFPTLASGTNGLSAVYCHHWSADGIDLFTFLTERAAEDSSSTKPADCKPLVRLPTRKGWDYYDLWQGTPAKAEQVDQMVQLSAAIGPSIGVGCLVAVRRDNINGKFRRLLASQLQLSTQQLVADRRNVRKPDTEPRLALATSPPSHEIPEGMVFVPGAHVRIQLEHGRRECGCYPDPATPEHEQQKFRWGTPFDERLLHDFTVNVKAFYIDETEVSNAQFKRFLEATHYRPSRRENFLKHWPGGKMPIELSDHPVVYVELNDARAYAKWAGKRLATEYEWHLAAQGTDGRRWPWGDELDEAHPAPRLVNTTGATLPVRALPDGRSPYGCYQMAGNVYEWTESERDDGHTRYATIRGGSFFQAKGSVWYMDGGPRPCTHHAKFILMWPGLDRCATIGFRCVKDAE
ncbi:MAG TPA: SUMF1/EgtB/PvdO family nonheme iron enzyme [Candidatus Limnocylindrales bacterium]|nr:SUMF1/EgtB/PvdO family nonheme iron enzyme [Candidatus Limnocylindrales bacterium]